MSLVCANCQQIRLYSKQETETDETETDETKTADVTGAQTIWLHWNSMQTLF